MSDIYIFTSNGMMCLTHSGTSSTTFHCNHIKNFLKFCAFGEYVTNFASVFKLFISPIYGEITKP